ncbi:MAG: ABC transporter ATP-binding protein [Syntrophales bacterium]|jgi:lipoprotein-releasing system ATP-binding protein|nr:ABC transporter ATP-binding protein [Syntrophales bacterium]MDY0044527.1 ABC transporter ATP-binding protein [Syntrophales bacterium]
MLDVRNLTKTFLKDGNAVEVLKGVNLEVTAHETVAILGVSGSGKTTLLQILGLLDHPSGGNVCYGGIDVFAGDEKKKAEFRNKRIGFVFQFHHLLPEFTALENAMMPAIISGMSKKAAIQRAETALTEAGLGDRLTHKPGELSGGEQQRVAVARAIIMEPELLLADEPTGNLDRETGWLIEELLLELNRKRGTTLIVVTHNMELAGRMARTLGLKDGKLYDS